MKIFRYIFVGLLGLYLSGCATILNKAYQPVSIHKVSGDTLKVDGGEPKMKNGKIMLRRDFTSKVVSIKREGFLEEQRVLFQHRHSPLFIMSVIPFGVVLFPPLADIGPKAFDYPKSITIEPYVRELPNRKTAQREVVVSRFGVKVKAEDVKLTVYKGYMEYLKDRPMAKLINAFDDEEDIELEQTIFAEYLNEFLKGKGFVEKDRPIYSTNFRENLYLDAELVDFQITLVGNHLYSGGTFWAADPAGFVAVDAKIGWTLKDIYGKELFTKKIDIRSNDVEIFNYSSYQVEKFEDALRDAMKRSLNTFLIDEDVQSVLKQPSVEELESSFELLSLNAADTVVGNLNDAVASSVTIKTSSGHGSGFFISEDGFLITNFHVISEAEDELEVVTNEGETYEATVIRSFPYGDLALLKVEPTEPVLPFKLSVGEEIGMAQTVFAIGTPNSEVLSQTVSKGIISAVRKVDTNRKLIQTDASVNGGNSGGALVNEDGVVVGVVSAKIQGAGLEGLGFAIPAYEVLKYLNLAFE